MNFVLVHGSGGGGWSWDAVRPVFEGAGHSVVCPSLSGMDDAQTTLQDHVDDVVRTITAGDLTGVQLVGHSYGGMRSRAPPSRCPGAWHVSSTWTHSCPRTVGPRSIRAPTWRRRFEPRPREA